MSMRYVFGLIMLMAASSTHATQIPVQEFDNANCADVWLKVSDDFYNQRVTDTDMRVFVYACHLQENPS